ncbi:MAG: tagaturonate epimerase family protein [Bacteroidota bacterium]
MAKTELDKLISQKEYLSNNLIELKVGRIFLKIYQNSIFFKNDNYIFIVKEKGNKFLYILSIKEKSKIFEMFYGDPQPSEENLNIKKCKLNHKNAEVIQEIFPFTNPVVVGLQNSFGYGDRLGLANSAHIRSLKYNEDFFPVLAQQSIRELTRTERTAEEVMDAAVWAVIQEGWTKGFGADADHLKTTEDIDYMVQAGFKMFTFDPGDHVVNEADSMNEPELEKYITQHNHLGKEDALALYSGKIFTVDDNFNLSPSKIDTLKAIVKYGAAIQHIRKLFNHLAQTLPDGEFEVEVSVDETDSVTSPFEHFFISNELIKSEVELVSLAPRFIGDFEKGIDYKGDLEIFKQEYLKHIAIANYFGTYKISLHSGSDKFGVYRVIGSLNKGFTHVKTAGTSYLEALRVVANTDPQLLRVILDFARKNYEEQKKTYHVSADLNKIKAADSYSNVELADLLNQNDARQVFHVTFGLVLTDKDDKGNYLFKDKILNCLNENEDLHDKFLTDHFGKHLIPFIN